jgi:hypothetical protein
MVSIEERFNKKLGKPDKNGCIKWKGWKNDDGYGKFSIDKKYKFAHRYAYELLVGKIPEGKNVLHKCDVRDCCNTEHLYIGTQHENNKDSHQRNRRSSKGSKNGYAKLKEKDVLWIKSMFNKISCASLSRMFNVSESCIHDIKHGRSWKDLK